MGAQAADPAADLKRAWPLSPGEVAAIAVSGGGDSFALLHAAHSTGHPIIALTVDHGLRETSAHEAQSVHSFCEDRQIPHETLQWEGPKPQTGLQEAAREARYQLLCSACERLGVHHLMTAHTADDQAETLFMRWRRSAFTGLGGMRPVRKIAAGTGDPILLHRPFLCWRRAELRRYALDHGLPMLDDPSNDDHQFERVRVRALLAALEQQDLLSTNALCALADKARAEAAPSRLTWQEALGAKLIEPGPAGELRLLPPPDLPRMVRHALLLQAVAAVGSPGGIDSDQACRFLAEADTGHEGIQTLGGCLVVKTASGTEMLREPAALLGRADQAGAAQPQTVSPGERLLYDHRFIVTVPKNMEAGAEILPFGKLLPRDLAGSTLARRRIATLPVLAKRGQLTHLPEASASAVRSALEGWKSCEAFLPPPKHVFEVHSLLAERFDGDVIRY